MSQSSSESLTEQKFSAVLSTVKRANTDNEKFAALLIVAKLTKAENLPDDKRRLLLRTIGFKFPIRLLSTACVKSSEGNKDSVAYASIGSSVLSLFCCDDELVQENGIKEAISPLLKAVKVFSNDHENSSNEIIYDCLNALEGTTRNEKCLEVISSSEILEILCDIRRNHEDQVLRIISTLLKDDPKLFSGPNNFKWLYNLVESFKKEQGAKKFEACDQLTFVFDVVQHTCNDALMPLIEDIILGLEHVLCSKITADQRRPALILASEVLRLVGISYFISKSEKENFVVILARIACIEIGLFFRDAHEKNAIDDRSQLKLLMTSFSIAECFCSAIAQFEQNEGGGADILSFDQIRLAQPALADMANSVTEFITEWLPQWRDISLNETLVLKSGVRMVGCWLNVENNVTSAQGIETLPLVPKMLSFVTLSRDWELLKMTLPVIMISADSSETMDVLIKYGVLQELLDTLRSLLESPFDGQEHLTNVRLVLQSLLSIYTSPNFTDISNHGAVARETIKMVVFMCEKPLAPRDVGYIYPLAAVLLKRLPGIDDSLRNVIQGVMKFVFDCHDISKPNGCLKVKESLKDIWEEISPLWQVCLQNLADCIQEKQFIKDIFLNSEYCVLLSPYFEAAKVSQDGEIIGLFFTLMEAVK